MKYLVSGGCGFVGSNLSAEVIRREDKLIIIDNLSRIGGCENLKWLSEQGKYTFHNVDVRNFYDVDRVIKEEKPDVVFHLAGQVAMTRSLLNPRLDFETNAVGTLNVLEALRLHNSNCIIIYASSNKVYGDLHGLGYNEDKSRYICPDHPNGFSEQIPLAFSSPYGCSKGAADQYVLDYYRMYGIRSIVFRHSSIYGSRQFATADQGWIGWFCQKALELSRDSFSGPITISGNGKQVRDILHIRDTVKLYFEAVNSIDRIAGEPYNIGGGIKNSLSIRELIELLEGYLHVAIQYDCRAWRQSDQKVFIADISKIRSAIGWSPSVSAKEGIRSMIDWLSREI